MKRLSRKASQQLKLLALFSLFAGPLVTAWAMVEWRIGIPDERVAHGQLMPAVPQLAEWPLAEPRPALAFHDWLLVYECEAECSETADRWWRLHRALGREAPRLTRLRLGQPGSGQKMTPLPGEVAAAWQARPTWSQAQSLWLVDPQGRVVLSYRQEQSAAEVLEDIRHLLRMNPQPEPISRQPELAVNK